MANVQNLKNDPESCRQASLKRWARDRKPPQDRFWAMVKKGNSNHCWEWQGSVGDWGYGKFNYEGRTQTASRVAYKFAKGDIPPNTCVMHTCDNPCCCNPEHLKLGTHADSQADKQLKKRGRWVRGNAHPNIVYSEELAKAVKAAYVPYKNGGDTLAKQFGISLRAVYNCLYRGKKSHSLL